MDLHEKLLTNSKPLWPTYSIGNFMGISFHVGKFHTIVNIIWSLLDKLAKLMHNSLIP